MYTMKKVNTLGVNKANFQPPGVTSSTYCTSKPSSFKEARRANIRDTRRQERLRYLLLDRVLAKFSDQVELGLLSREVAQDMVDAFLRDTVAQTGASPTANATPDVVAATMAASACAWVESQMPRSGFALAAVAKGGVASAQTMALEQDISSRIDAMRMAFRDLDSEGKGYIDVDALMTMVSRHRITEDKSLVDKVVRLEERIGYDQVRGTNDDSTGLLNFYACMDMLERELCPSVIAAREGGQAFLDAQKAAMEAARKPESENRSARLASSADLMMTHSRYNEYEQRSVPVNAVTGVPDLWAAVVAAKEEEAARKEQRDRAEERAKKAKEREILLGQMADMQASRVAEKRAKERELVWQQNRTQYYEQVDREKAAGIKRNQHQLLASLGEARAAQAREVQAIKEAEMSEDRKYLAAVQERERAKRIEERKLRQQAKKDYVQTSIDNDRLLRIKERALQAEKDEDVRLMKEFEQMQIRQDNIRAEEAKKMRERVEAMEKIVVNMEKNDGELARKALEKAERERAYYEKKADEEWKAKERRRKAAMAENLAMLDQQVAFHKQQKQAEHDEGQRRAAQIQMQIKQANLKEERKKEALAARKRDYCRDILQQQKDDIYRKAHQNVMSPYEQKANRRQIEAYATPRLVASPLKQNAQRMLNM